MNQNPIRSNDIMRARSLVSRFLCWVDWQIHASSFRLAYIICVLTAVLMTPELCLGDAVGSDQAAQTPPSANQQGDIDFDTQVIPVLTRYGCNSGACHGAAIGRGGFHLSLFGSRPSDDYFAIVRELQGRRINLVDSEQSVLLAKATESIEHGGGERFSHDSPAYVILKKWIRQGAKKLELRTLSRVEIQPSDVLLDRPGDSLEIRAKAFYSDGTVQDVSAMTVFVSDDKESVSVDNEQMKLTVHRRGEHVVIARYLDQVQPIRLAVPFSQVGKTEHGSSKSKGLIDRHIESKLRQLGIPASTRANDYEFARRVWIDLAGRLPTVPELTAFVNDTSPSKRAALVDRLLAGEEFAVYWGLKWANLIGIDSKRMQPEGSRAFQQWLVQLFREDQSWKVAAQRMLTTDGDSFSEGEINFLRSADGADGLAETATRVLMGVRLRCANCHDHPLDQWNQDDYHGLAAIFARVQRGRFIKTSDRGEVTHPVTGQPAKRKLPGTRFLEIQEDGRQAFADWVTSENNPYFARAAVNRVWSQLMGRGLIHPVDDIRSTNPASHPELLIELAESFAKHGYRFKPLLRQICTSDAYMRSSAVHPLNQSDVTYYSHFLTRGLEAEFVANAMADVLGVPIQYTSDGTKNAFLLTDNRAPSEILDILGRCDRETACETPAQEGSSLAKVLHFLNGNLINDRLKSSEGQLSKWLRTFRNGEEIIRRMYLRTLSRHPSEEEQQYWKQQILIAQTNGQWPDTDSRQNFYADVYWGLLTSDTFLTNH